MTERRQTADCVLKRLRAMTPAMKRGIVVALALAGCSNSNHGTTGDDHPGDDDDVPSDTGSTSACPREAALADRTRHVVISHPFTDAGKGTLYDVLDVTATGQLSKPGRPFNMAVGVEGTIEFTADGKVGMIAQDDGSLGVFALADDGTPTVIDPQFKGGFYASQVVMAGDHAFVLDGDTTGNGGGIYRVDIACDGTPTSKGLVAAANLPGAFAFLPGGDRAVIASTQFGTSAAGADAELVMWGDTPTLVDDVDAFGDDMALVGGATLTASGGHFLIGDRSEFSGIPNRVAVVQVGATGLTKPTVIPNINDPYALIASPFGEVVLAIDGYGNAMHVLEDNGSGYALRGDVAYKGTAPQDRKSVV